MTQSVLLLLPKDFIYIQLAARYFKVMSEMPERNVVHIPGRSVAGSLLKNVPNVRKTHPFWGFFFALISFSKLY